MARTINARTEIYAILGDPVSHCMSPVLMNSTFNHLQMDKVFLALNCNKDTCDKIMPVLKILGLKGYTITMPVKEMVFPYLDAVSEEAELIGAVNCISNENGRLKGYNTDSIGFWQAVEAQNTYHKQLQSMFLLGRGGFAKAALTQAAIQGVKRITVAGRRVTTEFSDFLKRLHERMPETQIDLVGWNKEEWKEAAANSDIIANATSLGLNGEGDLEKIFPYEELSAEAIVFDAVYVPRFTPFLQLAKERGNAIAEGLDLLVYQGVAAFEIWTGEKADPVVMKEDILQFFSK